VAKLTDGRKQANDGVTEKLVQAVKEPQTLLAKSSPQNLAVDAVTTKYIASHSS
jgi:hypothetical protein